MVLGSIGSFVAAVAGMYRLGRLCFGPVVGRRGRAAAAEPLLRREPRRPGLPGHLLRGADHVGDRARGGTPAARDAGLPDARRGGSVAPRRVGARRRLLAVVLLAGRQPHAPAVPGAGGDRAGAVGRRGRDRHRQPALLADRHRGPRPELERTQGFRRRRPRCGLRGADRQAPGARSGRSPGSPWRCGWLRGARWRRSPRSWCCWASTSPRARSAPRSSTATCWAPRPRCCRSAPSRSAAGRCSSPARAAPGWIAAAVALVALRRRSTAATHDQPLQPAHHPRRARGLPQGSRRRARQPRREARAAPLSVALAARQQADPRRPLDPRQRRPEGHRRAQPGARRRSPRERTSSRSASARAASRSIRSGGAVFVEAIVDVGDDPRDQVPLAGFKRIYTSRYYAVYANC